MANTTSALIAVVSIVLVEFVSGLASLVGTTLVVHPFGNAGTGASLLGSFVTGVFTAPLPYYLVTFLALAFLTPIARRSPLPTVLVRALLAGAAGTVALVLVGMATALVDLGRPGAGGRTVAAVVTGPLANGVPFTLMLLGTATVAWLWTGRPGGARPGARGGSGRLGTVRPADAVPSATVQQPGQAWGQPQPGHRPAPQPGAQTWSQPAPPQPGTPAWVQQAPEQPGTPAWPQQAPQEPSWGQQDPQQPWGQQDPQQPVRGQQTPQQAPWGQGPAQGPQGPQGTSQAEQGQHGAPQPEQQPRPWQPPAPR
ncbi:hypothetical protein [Curtobacterium sp. MCBA15_012]|uniref:hypothetical protein n=1 Tax=Curtobacterium sp. MCBA15_012 TaxID=1898738 RepID=UPI00273470C4|nr:hypothetical protein [Curtobacterium sp. MCBA15_012]WIB01138.1 hypothetical protein QOL15_05455 [Curtobacterium sp. MCBA15_012]